MQYKVFFFLPLELYVYLKVKLISFGDMNSKLVGSIETSPGLFQGKNCVSCSWKIKPGDFFSIENTGDSLVSPIITCLDERNKGTLWQIIVYPKGNGQQDSKYVSVFLKSLNSNPCEVFFGLNIFQAYCGSSASEFKLNQTLGSRQLIKQKWLCSFFNVYIKAKVYIIRTISIPKTLSNIETTEQDNTNQLVEDIGNIYLNDDISDCKIVCDGQEISCHVVILAARSPVFAAMMAQPLEEKDAREICIEDFTFEIVKGEF